MNLILSWVSATAGGIHEAMGEVLMEELALFKRRPEDLVQTETYICGCRSKVEYVEYANNARHRPTERVVSGSLAEDVN